MKDSMIPYMMLRNEKGLEQDALMIELVEYSQYVFIDEHYCCKPTCTCNNVLLTFFEITKEGKVERELLNLTLNFDTWKCTNKNVIIKEQKYKEMLKDFISQLSNYEERFKLHYSETKEYGKMNISKYINEDLQGMIMKDNLIGYSEIFGAEDVEAFSFEYSNSDKYTAYEQYCMNPKCLCNEVMLSFIKVDLKKKIQHFEFVVRVNLKSFKYSIEERKCENIYLEEVIKYFMKLKPETMKIIKDRYSRMKKVGREVIADNNKKEQMKSTEINEVIGRNSVCPCGSGEKYKKCCGNT